MKLLILNLTVLALIVAGRVEISVFFVLHFDFIIYFKANQVYGFCSTTSNPLSIYWSTNWL